MIEPVEQTIKRLRRIDARVTELEAQVVEPEDVGYHSAFPAGLPHMATVDTPRLHPWRVTLDPSVYKLYVRPGTVFWWWHYGSVEDPSRLGWGGLWYEHGYAGYDYGAGYGDNVYLKVVRTPDTDYYRAGYTSEDTFEVSVVVTDNAMQGDWNTWYYLLATVTDGVVDQRIHADIYIRDDPAPMSTILWDITVDAPDGWEDITPSPPAYLMAGDGTPPTYDTNGDDATGSPETSKWKLIRKL